MVLNMPLASATCSTLQPFCTGKVELLGGGCRRGKELAHSGRDTKAEHRCVQETSLHLPIRRHYEWIYDYGGCLFHLLVFHLQTDPWTGFKCLWLRGVCPQEKGLFSKSFFSPLQRGLGQQHCNFLLQDLSCLQTHH